MVNTLRQWRLKCPNSEIDLVFPNGRGKPQSQSNFLHRVFHPLQESAGIVNEDGRGRYGLHALRHAAAALFIEQGLSPKRIQKIMGHASIGMTFDVYGYLFESNEEDHVAVAQIQARLLG